MLPSERIIAGGLRVFLLADGRVTSLSCGETPQSLLPAEGAIFLTNYRVVFKGQPCDLFRMLLNGFTFVLFYANKIWVWCNVAVCEQVVVRSMTVMSIMKEKPIGDASSQSSQLEGIPVRVVHQLHDAFQIRSSGFQVNYYLIKLLLYIIFHFVCSLFVIFIVSCT